MVNMQVIATMTELLAMRGAWEELLDRVPTTNIFLTFDWLATWWRYYGRGAGLRILTFYDGGHLIGLAPLMTREVRLAGITVFRRVAFLGTGISDRLDLLIAPGWEAEVVVQVLTYLTREPWDMVDLHEIPDDSATAKLIPEYAERLGLRVEVQPQSVCPVIKLPADPEAYLASLGWHLRRNLRYYSRKLSREHTLRTEFFEPGPGLSSSLDAFLGVYRMCLAGRRSAGDLLGERFDSFRRDVVPRFASNGRLIAAILVMDGSPVAGELCFRNRGSCFSYNLCHHPTWKRERVGTILQWEVLRRAITEGCHEFDYGRGDEAYKYQWGATPRRHVRIRLARTTVKGSVLRAVARLRSAKGLWQDYIYNKPKRLSYVDF